MVMAQKHTCKELAAGWMADNADTVAEWIAAAG